MEVSNFGGLCVYNDRLRDNDTFVNINYDNSKYLPADNKIKEGLDLLESEFGSSGYLLVMVEASRTRNGLTS